MGRGDVNEGNFILVNICTVSEVFDKKWKHRTSKKTRPNAWFCCYFSGSLVLYFFCDLHIFLLKS